MHLPLLRELRQSFEPHGGSVDPQKPVPVNSQVEILSSLATGFLCSVCQKDYAASLLIYWLPAALWPPLNPFSYSSEHNCVGLFTNTSITP